MFRLIAATLVVLYMVFLVLGDESRRPEQVARAEPSALLDFDFSAWIAPAVTPDVPRSTSGIGEAEAIRLAMEAGRVHREARQATPLMGTLVAAVESPADAGQQALTRDLWYVTGTTVNVRSGPGTGNPVVTQVRFGEAAEVLEETPEGWIRIKPEGRDTIGWISSRFLDPVAPG